MGHQPLSEKLRRFFLTAEELEATELRESAEDSGCQTLAGSPPRSVVRLQGTVTSVTSDADNGWLEAEMNDGTGTLRLIWMGRDRLSCLLPGRHIRVTGRLAAVEGHPVIYNPDYEILRG